MKERRLLLCRPQKKFINVLVVAKAATLSAFLMEHEKYSYVDSLAMAGK
jgi:hypothetical protein